MAGARGMAQLVKYLPCKHKTPNSFSAAPLPPKKAKLPVAVCACIPSAGKMGGGRSLACCPANQPCLTVESLSENKEDGWSSQRATLSTVFWQAWTSIYMCSSHTHMHKIKTGYKYFTSSLLSNSGIFLQSLFL